MSTYINTIEIQFHCLETIFLSDLIYFFLGGI